MCVGGGGGAKRATVCSLALYSSQPHHHSPPFSDSSVRRALNCIAVRLCVNKVPPNYFFGAWLCESVGVIKCGPRRQPPSAAATVAHTSPPLAHAQTKPPGSSGFGNFVHSIYTMCPVLQLALLCAAPQSVLSAGVRGRVTPLLFCALKCLPRAPSRLNCP